MGMQLNKDEHRRFLEREGKFAKRIPINPYKYPDGIPGITALAKAVDADIDWGAWNTPVYLLTHGKNDTEIDVIIDLVMEVYVE